MRRQVRKHSLFLKFSMISSCVSSAALLLCIFAVRSDLKIYLFLIPVIFWFGLIAEQVFFWKANSILKQIINTGQVRRSNTKPGIIAPLQTELGAIADLIFVVSLIVFLILVIGNWGNSLFQFIFLFLIVLSFRVHCIANGKNYWYKKYLSRRRG